ncbi:unnamed protein product [Euphydryas editha]|uniref:PiggyBac transposable element-derived protein domain-containing protein n=1 Tax=Euphydryas editha TaxID=104508 RepID=A0AAU9UFA4_EUPED|nr:unnamed protein product [Euphydryas editha]
MSLPGTSGIRKRKENDFLQKNEGSKKFSATDPRLSAILDSMLNEDESGSEADDIEQNYVPPQSDHDTASETEESDSGEQNQLDVDTKDSSWESDENIPLAHVGYLYGKNKYKWSKIPPNRAVRTPAHNIVQRQPPTNLTQNDEKDPFSIWKKLIDKNILEEILLWTNLKLAEVRSKYARENKSELHDLDMLELLAFIGLLGYTAVFKSNHENADYIFATDGTGREIFRAVMSKNRFLNLLRCM